MAEPRQSSPATAAPDAASELADLRRQIDDVDRAILASLNERARLVQAVGGVKEKGGVGVYEAGRERRIVEELTRANAGPFPNAGTA